MDRRTGRLLLLAALLVVTALLGSVSIGSGRSASAPTNDVVLEDYTDIVTEADLGIDDFSGNTGVLNKTDRFLNGRSSLACGTPTPTAAGVATPNCHLSFNWDFARTADPDQESFTGVFWSLFGLTDLPVRFDTTTPAPGVTPTNQPFLEHNIDLDRIDGQLLWRARSVGGVCVRLAYESGNELKLKLELKDADGGLRYWRARLAPAPGPRDQCWSFRDVKDGPPDERFVPGRAKVFSLIVERQHVGDRIRNPDVGRLDVHRLWFTLDPTQAEQEPASDDDLLDLLERRTYQYFYDWSGRKPAIMDLPQDRSTSAALLTVGGVGFALPAHVVAARRGWIAEDDAARRMLNVLEILNNAQAFGPGPVGTIGYNGWFYHFLGTDGRRKQNIDYPNTPIREDIEKTVELSTIDTALALMGVLAAQSYAGGVPDSPPSCTAAPAPISPTASLDEIKRRIRDTAECIYQRVDWNFMLEDRSQQFYLGWKPKEGTASPDFRIPDRTSDPTGYYSSKPIDGRDAPSTLDYYTDEALIPIILGASRLDQRGLANPERVYCSLKLQTDEPLPSPSLPVPTPSRSAFRGFLPVLSRGAPLRSALVRSWPGSLFTYQFLHAFLDTRGLSFPACGARGPINWFLNSREATFRAIDYAAQNPKAFRAYGPNGWGLSAAEGPDDVYRADGGRTLAVDPTPQEDGTVTYYGMMSAVTLGDDLRQRAMAALRDAWRRGYWHPRFGLPDAFNDDVAQIPTPGPGTPTPTLTRREGAWLQRSLFAIDQGPMLLHLENARSGTIWGLLGQNQHIKAGLSRLAATPTPTRT